MKRGKTLLIHKPHPPPASPPHAAQTAAPQSVTPVSRADLPSPHPPQVVGGASGYEGRPRGAFRGRETARSVDHVSHNPTYRMQHRPSGCIAFGKHCKKLSEVVASPPSFCWKVCTLPKRQFVVESPPQFCGSSQPNPPPPPPPAELQSTQP
eukprot:scaffold4685_cov173-Pinguiococcus_pyrenoidosus.AAC.2